MAETTTRYSLSTKERERELCFLWAHVIGTKPRVNTYLVVGFQSLWSLAQSKSVKPTNNGVSPAL